MSFQTRFCPSACAALALVMVSMSGSFLNGQTSATPSLAVSPVVSGARTASATFMTAPAFALTEAPSSAVATDLDGDGKPDLILSYATAGKVSVYLGKGKGTFADPIDYSVGGHPTAILAVDIDGDGTKDIVTANGTDGTVSVLLTLAGGKLGPTSVYTVGADANILAAGDLNGDGKQDIVVASQTGKALAVLLNDGQKSLLKPTVQALGKTPTALSVGDFNGDSHADVAVAGDDGSVDALAGAGDGTLKLSASIKASSSKLSSIVAGDFSGTGKLDLAVTEADGRTLTTLLAKGDGTFTKGSSYKVGNHPSSTVVADVNGDGIPDLISLNQGSNTLSVLLGNGDGTFKSTADLTVGDGPVALAAADFQGSGYTGLAVVNASSKNVNVIAGKGDGTFGAAPSYSGDLSPRAIASGDLNGDGLPDIVVTNFCGSDAKCGKSGSLSVYLAQKSGGYTLASTQSIGAGPVSVALADLNGDGILDVVALNRGDKSLSVLLGVGDGTLQPPTTTPLAGSPVAVVAKDLDKDGKLDLAIVSDCGSTKCSQRGSVDTYFGRGDGTFHYGSSTPVNYSPTSIAAGDLNGDGVLDLVVANSCGKDASCTSTGTATVLLGAAQGTFTPQPDIALNNSPSSIALRASSGSKTLDLVVSHEADSTVAVLPGNGDGTFKSASLYTVGASPRSIVIADLNGDGRPDVAVANAKDSTVSVLYGQADGTLVAGQSYAVAAGPEALTAVAATSGVRANLVTASGNSMSSTPGSEITALANSTPNLTSTSTSITVTPTSGTVNSMFTLQATTSAPDGESITFSSDVGTLTDCQANSAVILLGQASCTTSQLTTQATMVTASYTSDGVFDSSTASAPVTVTAAAATLAVSSSASTVTVNQPVTFTATLSSGTAFTPTAPSGSVTIVATSTTGVATTVCQSMPVMVSGGVASASCPSINTLPASTYSVVASYSGDNNFTSPNSPSFSQPVNKVADTLSLTSSSSTSTINQPVTFTATIGPAGSTSPTPPTGSISFSANGTAISACQSRPITGTTATCQIASLGTFADTITATYAGDGNYLSANAPAITQSVNPISATTMITASTPSAAVNQAVTFTATLQGSASGPVVPTGTVTFTQGADTLCNTVPLPLATGNATSVSVACVVAFTAVSPGYAVTATYTPSGTNFTAGSPATTSTIPVNAATTTVTLATPVPSPSTVNQSVAFTASVAPQYSGSAGIVYYPSSTAAVPAGTVNFIDQSGSSSATVCSTSLTGTSASCSSSTLALGMHSIQATFVPTGSNFTSTTPSNTVVQNVVQSSVSITVTPSTISPFVNQQVTFTSTITPATAGNLQPNGTLTITDQLTQLPICVLTVTNGVVPTCMPSFATTGQHPLTATYANDPNYAGITVTLTTETVSSAATTTQLTLSNRAPSVDASVTFTATVVPAYSGGAVPSGTVTLNDSGNSPLCTITLSNGTGNCTSSFLTVTTGTRTVFATYVPSPSNNTFQTSVSSLTQVTVSQAATTVVLAAISPSPSSVNQPLTLSATVSHSATDIGMTAPMGTVTFLAGTTTLCTSTSITAAGIATCASAPTIGAPGNYQISAKYNGDNNFTSSVSPSTAQTVNPVAANLTLSSSSPSSVVDQPVTFTAILGAVSGTLLTSPTAPSGTIAFTVTQNGNSVNACQTSSITQLTGGAVTATCVTNTLATGSYTVIASYTGDTNFVVSGNNSNSVAQTVSPVNATLLLTSSSPASVVDQTVTFTATLGAGTGTLLTSPTAPSGTIAFTITQNGASLNACQTSSTTQLSGGTVSATCVAPALVNGTYTVTASYTKDPNFVVSGTNSNSVTQTVSAATTSILLTSASPTIVATTSVTYTAILSLSSPAVPGAIPVAGTITFTAAGGGVLASNCALATSPIVPGKGYTCSITFPTGIATSFAVTATFNPADGNFKTTTSTAPQAVQDFSVQFVTAPGSTTPFAGPLNVAQSYSNTTDPFTASPTLATTVSTLAGFAEPLTYVCSLPASAIGLTCSVTPGTGGAQTVVFTAARTATLGTYLATITARDTVTASLSRSTTLTVNVGATVTTSLSPGVTGTVSVPFTVPAPQDTFNFACPQILLITTQFPQGTPSTVLKCTPVATTGTLASGSAGFIISPVTQTSMVLPQSKSPNRVFAAAFFCVPLLALAGCFGRRRSASRNFIRFLAALTLLAGVSQTIGCGGGFTPPTQTAVSTSGNYLIQITATDTSQTSKPVYYAVIPVAVQ